jgi:hypothetical protein
MPNEGIFTFNLTGKPFNIKIPDEVNALEFLHEGEQILKKHFDDYLESEVFKSLAPDHKLSLVALNVAYEFAKEKSNKPNIDALNSIKELVDMINHITESV